jgi:hypothetical protein
MTLRLTTNRVRSLTDMTGPKVFRELVASASLTACIRDVPALAAGSRLAGGGSYAIRVVRDLAGVSTRLIGELSSFRTKETSQRLVGVHRYPTLAHPRLNQSEPLGWETLLEQSNTRSSD